MNRTGLYGSAYTEETNTSESCPASTIAVVQGPCKERKANELTCVEDGSDESLVAGGRIIQGFVEAGGYINSAQDADIITGTLLAISFIIDL